MIDEETKKWIWDTYKTCYAILLVERVSVMCIEVYKDEDIAKHNCEDLQRKYPQNRYDVAAVPIGKVLNNG